LAGGSAVATIFQHPAWFDGFAASPAGFLGMVFSDSQLGPIRGLAVWERRLPGIWRLAGTSRSDYADLLAEPGAETEVAETLARHLTERPGWHWIDLPQSRPGSVASRIPGLKFTTGETCPACALPSDWETFQRRLGKSLRGNIGYYARALAKLGTVEIRTADTESFERDMEDFFHLHQRRWRSRWMPGAFADRRSREYHLRVASQLLDAGRLRLHTLRVDSAPVASLYCFATTTESFYYLGGFDPEYAKFSPGTVLTAHAIRHAIEHDRSSRFDFLRGNESYKYKWGAVDCHNLRLALVRGKLGEFLTSTGAAQLRLELQLKNRMHARFGGAGKQGSGVRGQESTPRTGNQLTSVAGSRSVGSPNVVAPIVPVSGTGQTEADR